MKADEDESKSNLESYTFKFSVDESAKHMQTHSIFEVFEKEMITPTFVTPTMQKQWFDMLLRTDGVLQTMIFSHNQKKILFRSSIERDVPQQYLCITEPNSNNVIWNTVYSCCTHTLSKEKKRVYAYQIATHLYIFVAAVPQLEKSAFLITYYSSLVAHSDGNKKYYPTLKSERGEILSHVEFTEIEISKFSLDVNRELTRTLDAIENAFPPPMLKKKESESIIDVKPKQNPLIFENVQTEQPEAKEEPKEEPRPDAEQVVHRPVRHYHTTFSSATSFDGSSPPVSGLVPKPPPLPPLSTPVAPKPPSMPNQNTFVRKKIFEPPAEKTQVETLAGEDSKNPIAQESNEKIFYQRGS